MNSRKVALTAAFLTLAAGGTAACDASSSESLETTTSTYDDGSSGAGTSDGDWGDTSDAVAEQDADEVFYCADEHGKIVGEQRCDDDTTSSYLLWHSTGYRQGLRPGTILHGGDHFPAGDRKARRAYQLPATGKVANGTVKTNIVGSNSGSSEGNTGGNTSVSSSGG